MENLLDFARKRPEKARLIRFLPKGGRGAKSARKPEKVYLENSNLLGAILGTRHIDPSIGTVRETFFCGQMQSRFPLVAAGEADFLVDHRITVEVGGPNKDARQIASKSPVKRAHQSALLAVDGFEVGGGSRVPLYLFGFLEKPHAE